MTELHWKCVGEFFAFEGNKVFHYIRIRIGESDKATYFNISFKVAYFIAL